MVGVVDGFRCCDETIYMERRMTESEGYEKDYGWDGWKIARMGKECCGMAGCILSP